MTSERVKGILSRYNEPNFKISVTIVGLGAELLIFVDFDVMG